MEPFFWLFLKIWPAWLVAVAVGFATGWAYGGQRFTRKGARLREEAETARAECEKATSQASKARDRAAKFQKQVEEARRSSVPKAEAKALKGEITKLKEEIESAVADRDDALGQAVRLKESTIPRTDLIPLEQALKDKDTAVENAQRELADARRQMAAGPKQVVVHDLGGFSKEQSDELTQARGELIRVTSERDELRNQLGRSQDSAKASTEKAREDAAKLRMERDILRADLSQVQLDAAAAAEAPVLHARIEERDRDIDELRRQLDDAIDELGELRRKGATPDPGRQAEPGGSPDQTA